MSWRLICCVIVTSFLWSCKDDEVTTPAPEPFDVTFDFQSKFQIKENDDTEIIIPIKLSESQTEPVSVTYEYFEQDVVNGSDFTILSENPLVISAGSTSVNVRVKINDNQVPQLEDRKIFLRIRSVDKAQAKFGVPSEVEITIEENDCLSSISTVENWFGALTIQTEIDTSTGTGLENSTGLCGGSFDIKGKVVGADNPESTLTIKLAKDSSDPTKGTATISRSKLFTFTSQFEIEAEGEYDETERKIVLNYNFFDLNNSANNFESSLLIIADQ
ncbi:MAG: Calx-beta domain-containing protein [Cyclobacteriaceae bacterium]